MEGSSYADIDEKGGWDDVVFQHLTVSEPKHWTAETPYLYRIVVSLFDVAFYPSTNAYYNIIDSMWNICNLLHKPFGTNSHSFLSPSFLDLAAQE